uniref:Xaa-Pro dipeptidyl-peptidase C-terminal domain-containing protein n=1 Tax=Pyrodinium bahamense TaxID=73915 RepID=A0A7S0A6L7_9DINO
MPAALAAALLLWVVALAGGAQMFILFPDRVAGFVLRGIGRLPHDLRPLFGLQLFFHLWLAAAVADKLSFGFPQLALAVRRSARIMQSLLLCMERPLTLAAPEAIDTCCVGEERNTLRAYLLLPMDLPGPFPTVIFRTPYGASPTQPTAVELAEHGFAVLVQDTRGRFSSEGEFLPVQHEREDGAATVEWVHKQPWCNGKVGVAGMSYVGMSAWAAIGTAGHRIDAALIVLSQSKVKTLVVDPNGAVSGEFMVRWFFLVFHVLGDGWRGFWRKLWTSYWSDTVGKALYHLPIRSMDQAILGRPLTHWQKAVDLVDDPQCPFWDNKDVLSDFSGATPPVMLLAGWYDLCKEGTLEDFRQAGERARLVILPIWHFGFWRAWPLLQNITLWMFQEHLEARAPPHCPLGRARVWASVLGEAPESFLPFADWPPPSVIRCYHLNGSELRLERGDLWQRSYRYNPADPTPNLGGPSFSVFNAGPEDQAEVEARMDVLVFTTGPLEEDLLIAGRVALELCAEVGSPSADFVGRLCVVSPGGKSVNLCEGLTRVRGPGEQRVAVDLGSVCCRFRAGHRVRLHVCSGAFPRWMRNLQTGEPVADATCMAAAWHAVGDGSVLRLPVIPDPPEAVEMLAGERWAWVAHPEKHHVRTIAFKGA